MTYSRLVAILWLAVIMFFTAPPADRCTTPTDPTCIRAVYQGAPNDYAQVQDIPADMLLAPDDDGRYHVERGQQITVVTAAPLPSGYTRFYLQRTPLERPSPTSYERLIPPVGTTFTFTSSSFEAAAEQLRYDLRAARPPLRPGLKPQLGDIVVTLRFTVTNPPPPTAPAPVDDALSGLPFTPGRYQFSTRPGGNPHLAFSIPTTAHHLEWGGLIINHNGMSLCLSATADDSFLCLGISSATTTSRHEASNARTADGVSIGDVFNYIAASASVDGTTGSQVKSDTLRYRSYDASGAVATPGSYAFLIDSSLGASVVATFEGLRDGTATALLVHQSDAYGASQAQVYDPILAGDLFEWRQADDCWVRYRVTEVKPDPTGIVPRKLVAVEWMTYAFTGCSGPIAGSVGASFAWGHLPDVGGASLTAPVVHGPFQIVPEHWTGATQEPVTRESAGYSYSRPTGTTDINEARQLPFWRDPTLPEGATLEWARSGSVSDPVYGYSARYHGGESEVAISGYDAAHRREPEKATWLNGRGARETRVIAGRPAIVIYSPPGPSYDAWFPLTVWIYDAAAEAIYTIRGENTNLTGSNVDRVIAIARSLFEPRVQLTVTAGEGGSVEPAGITTQVQGQPVTLTASWNDATHTFGGWGGDCSGAATACTLEMYADHSVTATFSELPATRCAQPEDADCIRAVYLGAPDDYAQVQDIPAELLLAPDTDGRYRVRRGEQVTVVTAAPLPTGYDRFILNPRPAGPPDPLSQRRLIPPVGTTYTFSLSTDVQAAELVTLDLHAARTRPGSSKPIPGAVVVTTKFQLPVPPLTLELTSSRDLCTASTLTELSWTISGGRPPYTLTIEGETVDPDSESHRANCGPIPADPMGTVPGTTPAKTFRASVTGSQATPDTATDDVQVGLAPALAAPTRLEYEPYPKFASVHWRSVVGAGSQSERVESRGRARYAAYHVRYRAVGATQWRYAVEDYLSYGLPSEWEQPGLGVHELEVAAIRHPLEAETPAALNWSERLRYAHGAPIGNASVTATVDTVTVQWEAQPLAGYGFVTIESDNGWRKDVFGEPEDAGTHRHIFEHVEPGTDYEVKIYKAFAEKGGPPVTLTVRTSPPPEGWTTPPLGPQNLRAIAARHGSLTCLTIDWDAPYANADQRYHIFVVEEETYLQIDSAVINDGTTRFFTCGRDTHRNVEPSRLYHIRVNHHGIRTGTATISITTPAKDTRAQSSTEPDSAPQVNPRPLPYPFRPAWPVKITEDYAYTDDPFDWRLYEGEHRYHAGLDIGGSNWWVAQ